MELRQYQERGLGMVLEFAVDHPHGRALLVMHPRSGKTPTLAVAIRSMAIENDVPALLVVPSKEVLDQAVDHLVRCGIDRDQIGIYYRDAPDNPAALLQVATEATLDRRHKPPARLVVWDEAHHDAAPRRRRIRGLYPEAFHLGVTGTPERLGGAGLGEDYDVMIVPVAPSELIHDGYLSVPTVYAPEDDAVPEVTRVRVRKGDYDVSVLEQMVLNEPFLDRMVSEWGRLSDGRRTIIYPVTVKHSHAIVQKFSAAGVAAQHLDGVTSPDRRRAILAGIRDGSIDVVSSVGVLSQGVDLPEVKCCVLARPTRSVALHIQQGSRCMTPDGKGTRPRILDMVGNCARLGFPFDDRAWSLHKRARRDSQNKDGREPLLKRCKCGAMARIFAASCEACSAPFVVAEPVKPVVPVSLREVRFTQEQIDRKRAQLEAFARERGFKPGWADRVLSAMISGDKGVSRETAA